MASIITPVPYSLPVLAGASRHGVFRCGGIAEEIVIRVEGVEEHAAQTHNTPLHIIDASLLHNETSSTLSRFDLTNIS